MARRSGVTLLEVLVAIFVMGIGLLALLTLFPLGALRMAKALQDDRCAGLAANARALAVMKAIPWDVSVTGSYGTVAWTVPLKTFTAVNDYPSFPVLVDSIGFNASFGLATGSQTNVAATSGPGGQSSFLSRTSASFVNPAVPTDAYQWFTGQDDVSVENAPMGTVTNSPVGMPQLLLPGPYYQAPLNTPMTYSRNTQYSYALLCQRPRFSDTSVVNVSVVVYTKRPVTPTAANVALPEYLYSAAYNLNANTITLDYTNSVPPPVRVGDWIMDNTYIPIGGANSTNGTAHAGFYRIVGLNDVGANLLECEVETPLRGFTVPIANMPAGTAFRALVLDGVAEVYNLGPVRFAN